MLKKYFLMLFIVFSSTIYSLEVNRDFIEIDLDLTVEFENYVGPYLFYNSVEEIRSIGSFLAERITPNTKSDANYLDKYLIAHRPQLEWEVEKSSCDVFQITSLALIDNVNNIELIISQYLMDNYGYSLNDSDLLAHLIVIYNAVNRGNADHFNHYTTDSVLTDNVEILGLDLQYQNWPGKTFIYIPLSNNISLGKLSNIDSDVLVEPSVINSIKLKDDKDIELREDIIEFKEREIDEITKTIEDSAVEINELEKKNEVEPSEIVKENIEELNTATKELKEELEDKEVKVLELRDDLAEDKNKLIVKEDQNIQKDKFPYIINRLVNSERHGQLVYVDINGNIVDKGVVNSIRNNSYETSGDYMYVIAGGDSENQLITLGQIANKSLSILGWAKVPCYESAPIIIKEKKIYTIIEIDSEYYIGEFNQELLLLRRSATNLVKESYILLKNGTFYIQGKYNSIKLANLSDFIIVSE